MTEWTLADTNIHQDHVIAHVIGATVLGYFVLEETAFLLLDIGFIWHIYLDGEMGLRPHPVAISELEIDQSAKSELQRTVDSTLQQRDLPKVGLLQRLNRLSPIQTVEFFARENSRRLLLSCEEGSIVIETSLETCEVRIMTANDESD